MKKFNVNDVSEDLDSNPYFGREQTGYNKTVKNLKDNINANGTLGGRAAGGSDPMPKGGVNWNEDKQLGPVAPEKREELHKEIGELDNTSPVDERKEASNLFGVELDKKENKYDDEKPNWNPETDDYYKEFDKDVVKGGYSDQEINGVINLAEDYAKDAQRGVITFKQMEDVANKMGLSNLSDKELRQAWDKYYNILNREAFRGGSMKRYQTFSDAASAFAEVINAEARRRKESGNYFPYDKEDIDAGKQQIKDIVSKHEGYDADSSEGYLTNEEAKQIKNLADTYHLTDQDLERISPFFGEGAYGGFGWKEGK